MNYNLIIMPLYFAYGSNMDQEQITERCPSAELISTAKLENHRLEFTIFSPKRNCGCADVIPSPGDYVYGLLFNLSNEDMRAMDEFEGHPIHYRRVQKEVVDMNNKSLLVETYEVANKEKELHPSDQYLQLIHNAAVKHAFPEAYIRYLSKFS